MALIRTSPDGSATLNSQSYTNERELQEAVSTYPALLRAGDDPHVSVVAREVSLPDAGRLDVLAVDAEGLPIAVEVKLASNPESRREVVGQIVDYVSVLTSLTVDELDRAVNGALEKALRSFSEDDDAAFNRRWDQAGTYLRAGKARYVIVVDEAPEDLKRILAFLVRRSNLDIRMVRIAKYPDSDSRLIYVPTNVVDVPASERPSRGGRTGTYPELQAVVESYSRHAAAEFPAVARGGPGWRPIRLAEWPSAIHYEFIQAADGISVEIHLESSQLRPIARILKELAEQPPASGTRQLTWDPTWWRNSGRVYAKFDLGTDPDVIADAMRQLIATTKDRLTAALSEPQPATGLQPMKAGATQAAPAEAEG